MSTRTASHAGSWYSRNASVLSKELDEWTGAVSPDIDGVGSIPKPGAKVIIAPHAGYAFSGPAAAWAYQCLDVSQAKRVFLLGPSHHKYLSGCALSKHASYATPLGNLSLDLQVIEELASTGKFDWMSKNTDEMEHSLEMHLPYLYRTLAKSHSPVPPIIPILVGNTDPLTEKAYGALLAPYLAAPNNVFVVSSDFCHWGDRFRYTYYLPSATSNVGDGHTLKGTAVPTDPPIHESISRIDNSAMKSVESGSHDAFLAELVATSNTVCGRHPIGVIMMAIETLKQQGKLTPEKGLFKFVRYERSNDVRHPSESSVSYASAFAVL